MCILNILYVFMSSVQKQLPCAAHEVSFSVLVLVLVASPNREMRMPAQLQLVYVSHIHFVARRVTLSA